MRTWHDHEQPAMTVAVLNYELTAGGMMNKIRVHLHQSVDV